jgi:hypothetical protein
MRRTPPLLFLSAMMLLSAAAGCQPHFGEPTRPYPRQLQQVRVADVQVFRDGPKATLVNASPVSYQDVSLWINQRYVIELESLPAGAQLTLDLSDARDEYGQIFQGGGFFAGEEPDPLVLGQLETTDGALIGLIVIPPRTLN